MIEMVDGPAIGITLFLKRAPLLLRVCFDPQTKQWDGLDQLADQPAACEQLHVYRRIGKPGALHIDESRKRCHWYAMAKYVYADPQPSDADMRDTKSWRAWALAHELEVTTEN